MKLGQFKHALPSGSSKAGIPNFSSATLKAFRKLCIGLSADRLSYLIASGLMTRNLALG